MRWKTFPLLIAIYLSVTLPVFSYEVVFEGIDCPVTLKLLQSASKLEKLKETPPVTLLGLKRRAEGDMETLIEALQSRGYYGAKGEFKILDDRSRIVVFLKPGPLYHFAEFKIHYLQNGEESDLTCPITLEYLNIRIGDPAFPESILSAEDLLLDKLNVEGFAFASIKNREVLAHQKENTVTVLLVVDTGPLTFFDSLNVTGLERVNEKFIYKKLRWQEGDLYSPSNIQKTQEALELSSLFKTVNISLAEEPIEGNLIPITINLTEAKQRSIGFGLNYTTSLGPGFTAEWEDRNIFGEGQKLSVRTDIWESLQTGSIGYLIPDFKRQNQNLIWLIDYQHERTKSFTENAFSFSGTIERKLTDHLRISYGGMYKRLRSQRSDFNGTFDLLKIPLNLRWSNADNILEPTQGGTLQLKVIPSLQMFSPHFAYSINTFTGSWYKSLTENKRHIFAVKLMAGSIFGASEHEIPPPERFYAGSESTLRGYRYLTVSPLGCHHHKPLGGRSMLIYSMELRNRIGKDFGLVFFYDIGNVYEKAIPDFKEKFRQSVGFGIRYYTPIGPIRLDAAFPLNKRSIDNSLEVYFSIGQSF